MGNKYNFWQTSVISKIIQQQFLHCQDSQVFLRMANTLIIYFLMKVILNPVYKLLIYKYVS